MSTREAPRPASTIPVQPAPFHSQALYSPMTNSDEVPKARTPRNGGPTAGLGCTLPPTPSHLRTTPPSVTEYAKDGLTAYTAWTEVLLLRTDAGSGVCVQLEGGENR